MHSLAIRESLGYHCYPALCPRHRPAPSASTTMLPSTPTTTLSVPTTASQPATTAILPSTSTANQALSATWTPLAQPLSSSRCLGPPHLSLTHTISAPRTPLRLPSLPRSLTCQLTAAASLLSLTHTVLAMSDPRPLISLSLVVSPPQTASSPTSPLCTPCQLLEPPSNPTSPSPCHMLRSDPKTLTHWL